MLRCNDRLGFTMLHASKNGAYLKKSTKSSHQVNDLLPQCMLILEKNDLFCPFQSESWSKNNVFYTHTKQVISQGSQSGRPKMCYRETNI